MRKAKVAKARGKKKARRSVRRAAVAAPVAGAVQGRQLPARGERDSIEDPLEDWSEVDSDRWVLERDAEDLQREE